MSGFAKTMSIKDVRILRRELQRDNRQFPKDKFVALDVSRVRPIPGGRMGPPQAAWRSRDFLCQVFIDGYQTQLSVNRTDLDNNGNWKADISWEELQWIKDSVGYADFDAVEVHPKKRDIVNVANMRHLFILNESLPFIWRKKETT